MSDAADALGFQLRVLDMANDCQVEYRFAPDRRWRFDFAWPAQMVAVEVDGGSWIGGRHTSGTGFEADCLKLSIAATLGWRVLRVTPRMVRDGMALHLIEQALAYGGASETGETALRVSR